ncbi:hypothetical protein VTO42DRAFT_5076 [Malbranchea cinnamomea]
MQPVSSNAESDGHCLSWRSCLAFSAAQAPLAYVSRRCPERFPSIYELLRMLPMIHEKIQIKTINYARWAKALVQASKDYREVGAKLTSFQCRRLRPPVGSVYRNIRPETILRGGATTRTAALVRFQEIRNAEGRTYPVLNKKWETGCTAIRGGRGAPRRLRDAAHSLGECLLEIGLRTGLTGLPLVWPATATGPCCGPGWAPDTARWSRPDQPGRGQPGRWRRARVPGRGRRGGRRAVFSMAFGSNWTILMAGACISAWPCSKRG